MSNTQIALEKIKWDYAKNGRDSGIATLMYIENRISRQRYNEYATQGLKIFNSTKALIDKLN